MSCGVALQALHVPLHIFIGESLQKIWKKAWVVLRFPFLFSLFLTSMGLISRGKELPWMGMKLALDVYLPLEESLYRSSHWSVLIWTGVIWEKMMFDWTFRVSMECRPDEEMPGDASEKKNQSLNILSFLPEQKPRVAS